MRTLRLLLIVVVTAVAGLTATTVPAQAGKPATMCEWNGAWYPHGWAGELSGRYMECSYGVWHMM
ncbi:hypothetical protein QEZ54_21445 [Catellatospora sp. KI3]|uniref:hypothetical protein n=1 Tax=Catellatospora sp. KI3 TaxID=3041620 RepID=UPI00248270E8|nr:hypothetical protein [Catellatospora sp. KI3]MDI1463551.1 hypothetical protein [Catellatospora sp. KI3]